MKKPLPRAVFVMCTLFASPALSEPAAQPASTAPASNVAAASTNDLQSPEQASTRYSAYSLPRGMWAFEIGALGIGGGDSFAKLGVAYGLGAGLELGLNLAHASVGLLNVTGRWQFVATRYFDLGGRLGFWYGHGEWFWILGDRARELVSKLDVVHVPIELMASMPVTHFLQFDLGVGYRHAELFGSVSDEGSIYVDSQLGLRQFAVRPGARWFMSDSTALELHAGLPLYSAVPRDGEDDKVPFSTTWSLEMALRSRFAAGVFGNLRLEYGNVAGALYGAPLYPAFELEFRL